MMAGATTRPSWLGEPFPVQQPADRQEQALAADDAALILRIGGGDQEAFAELLTRHESWARTYAWRVVGNVDEAEDIVQEAFLEVWTKSATWKKIRNFRGFFAVLLSRRCIDFLRKKRPIALEEVPDMPADDRAAVVDKIEGEQRAGILQRGLQSLPARQRMAILLFHTEEMSLAEGAEAMNITPKAFESLLIRARVTLRRVLTGREGSHE